MYIIIKSSFTTVPILKTHCVNIQKKALPRGISPKDIQIMIYEASLPAK